MRQHSVHTHKASFKKGSGKVSHSACAVYLWDETFEAALIGFGQYKLFNVIQEGKSTMHVAEICCHGCTPSAHFRLGESCKNAIKCPIHEQEAAISRSPVLYHEITAIQASI